MTCRDNHTLILQVFSNSLHCLAHREFGVGLPTAQRNLPDEMRHYSMTDLQKSSSLHTRAAESCSSFRSSKQKQGKGASVQCSPSSARPPGRPERIRADPCDRFPEGRLSCAPRPGISLRMASLTREELADRPRSSWAANAGWLDQCSVPLKILSRTRSQASTEFSSRPGELTLGPAEQGIKVLAGAESNLTVHQAVTKQCLSLATTGDDRKVLFGGCL